MNEYRMQFDRDMLQMKELQSSALQLKKLTGTMLDIMERRFHNMDARLRCLYKLKMRFFVEAVLLASSARCVPPVGHTIV